MNDQPSPPVTQRPRWSTATKILIVILLIVAAVALLQRIQSIMVPLILAAILAFILNPVVNFFNRWAHIPRSLVLLIIYLAVAALIDGKFPYSTGTVIDIDGGFQMRTLK